MPSHSLLKFQFAAQKTEKKAILKFVFYLEVLVLQSADACSLTTSIFRPALRLCFSSPASMSSMAVPQSGGSRKIDTKMRAGGVCVDNPKGLKMAVAFLGNTTAIQEMFKRVVTAESPWALPCWR